MANDSSDAASTLLDGFDHVQTEGEFRERIARGKPLRVKLGLDPTTPDLHLGHAVVLHKLQQFVEHGDRVTLVIGDFTARIGDPTGRNEMRPSLSDEAIESNMRTYAEQAGRVLDLDRVELRYNSEWLAPLSLREIIRLLAQTTVAQMLERNDFRERYESGTPIALHEFLYPVAQAYDSVVLEADVELGGNDQLFNFLVARRYQEHAGQRPQVCMTVPLLEGLDGVKKMSKSVGNYVGLTEASNDQFGKLMRIPDEMIPRYARLADFRSLDECRRVEEGIRDGTLAPMEEKKRLAESVVARYWGADAARAAREHFERTIQRREIPDHVPEMALADLVRLADIIVAAKFAESKRAAQRLIAEGAVRIDGVPVTDVAATWTSREPAVVQVGSRRFVRVLPNER